MPQVAMQIERRVAEDMATIEARGLRKAFGTTVALDGIDLRVEEGRILGLVGPNGAGKSTALNAILGLTPYQGELQVLGRDPWNEHEQLMREVCFIADVAVLPRWMHVSQALDYVAGVHPRFDRTKAEGFLARTAINRGRIVLDCSMDDFESRYAEALVNPDHLAAARALKPIHERQVFGRSILLFQNADRNELAALGEVHTPSIADLFVAVIGNEGNT